MNKFVDFKELGCKIITINRTENNNYYRLFRINYNFIISNVLFTFSEIPWEIHDHKQLYASIDSM